MQLILRLTLLASLLLAGCSGMSTLRNDTAAEPEEETLNRQALRHLVRGAFQETMHDPKRAVYEYNLALLHDSSSVEIRRALAENYLLLGEYNYFLRHAKWILAEEPDDRRLRARLAFVYHHLGDLDATTREIRILLQDMPAGERSDPEIGESILLTVLMDLELARGDSAAFKEAMHDYLRGGYIPEAALINAYHDLVEQEGSHQREIRFTRQLLEELDHPFPLALMLVDLLVLSGENTVAGEELTAVCQDNAELLESWYSLAFFQRYTLEQPDLARETLQQGLERFPDGSSLKLELSDLEEEQGNLDAAEELLLDLVETGGDRETGQLYLSDFYLRHHRFRQEAIDLYRQLLTGPQLDDPTLMNNCAYLIVEAEEEVTPDLLQEALQYSERSLAMQPENSSFLDTNGWIHYRLGDLEMAEKQLRAALRLSPEEPIILEHLSAVLREQDPEEADLLLRRAGEFRRLLEIESTTE